MGTTLKRYRSELRRRRMLRLLSHCLQWVVTAGCALGGALLVSRTLMGFWWPPLATNAPSLAFPAGAVALVLGVWMSRRRLDDIRRDLGLDQPSAVAPKAKSPGRHPQKARKPRRSLSPEIAP